MHAIRRRSREHAVPKIPVTCKDLIQMTPPPWSHLNPLYPFRRVLIAPASTSCDEHNIRLYQHSPSTLPATHSPDYHLVVSNKLGRLDGSSHRTRPEPRWLHITIPVSGDLLDRASVRPEKSYTCFLVMSGYYAGTSPRHRQNLRDAWHSLVRALSGRCLRQSCLHCYTQTVRA